jgi:hypothetical protein
MGLLLLTELLRGALVVCNHNRPLDHREYSEYTQIALRIMVGTRWAGRAPLA